MRKTCRNELQVHIEQVKEDISESPSNLPCAGETQSISHIFLAVRGIREYSEYGVKTNDFVGLFSSAIDCCCFCLWIQYGFRFACCAKCAIPRELLWIFRGDAQRKWSKQVSCEINIYTVLSYLPWNNKISLL